MKMNTSTFIGRCPVWSAVVAMALVLLGGVGSALAQPRSLTQVRNDSSGRWTFGLGCGSTVVTLDPNQFVYVDPANLTKGCPMNVAPATAKEAAPPSEKNSPQQGTDSTVGGLSQSGSAYFARGQTTLTFSVGQADKTAFILVDGVIEVIIPASKTTTSRTVGSKGLLPGPHTVTLIGMGKGTFNVSVFVQMRSGIPNSAPVEDLIMLLPDQQSPAPANPAAGDFWVVTKTF